jgi:hypothetical protein
LRSLPYLKERTYLDDVGQLTNKVDKEAEQRCCECGGNIFDAKDREARAVAPERKPSARTRFRGISGKLSEGQDHDRKVGHHRPRRVLLVATSRIVAEVFAGPNVPAGEGRRGP